jgi:serine/threonine-protein kinase
MPELMVWPPPKVLGTSEGDITVERPHGGTPEVSSVVPGVQGAPPGVPFAPSAAAVTAPAPALPGATVSVMAATSTPHDWLERPEGLVGSVLGSRYRITSFIGRGPMGIACEGESSRGRQVTLKLMPRAPELPLEHFAWQVRQALALAHFDHPNVAPFSDFGALDDGSAFVSRPRTPGVTLRTILRQGGLPMRRALSITRELASALSAAHAQDISHGRLKPENVIVHGGSQPGDLVKIVDFGMASLPVNLRAVAPSENEARRLALRTRIYLPPNAAGSNPRIDVYALGVMLFEMISGQPPFVLEAMPPAGPQMPPLSFAQVNPTLSVPPSVNELVLGLLHPQAAEHGLNAAQAVQMLDALLGRPSVAAPDPVTSQMPSAPPPRKKREPRPETPTVAPPDIQAFTAPNSAALVWPSSPAPPPLNASSFPPLPQGVATFPPPAVAAAPSPMSSFPPPTVTPPPPPAAPASMPPPMPPSMRQQPPSSLHNPAAPPSMRDPGRADEPFTTPSFPPPAGLPTGIGTTSDDDEEFRPSFIGRLKRLFTKKRPDGF